ncbi:AraC family transcriptional regulator [Streptomyces cyaneofuscatus]|uniref:AraC family transcriptional regulator n=1 Tax=Streptomyces cyaneofuscatus TaxID=66883 RepID=A0ABZ1F5R4_9ACTN|nr:AraC family transcriptional regulator [Streptomyces cyaneofuscatus]WSB11754.1 AraC family transcriptional regulator [Streptomyces cyaneofuscatus]WSD44713.1 AraC family transcriptional regulator [Streptomyces cyaneofuscatus]WTA87909.1 AraC family transcriptional regulator [Streptomyces cyaneofuscatus]
MESAITRAVVQVIAHMHHNFREDLTIDGIAQAAGFSRFHLTREFTHLIGVSPRRFLRALRFEEAKRLLSDSRLNVAEISHAVGYSSVGTFSTCFKSCTGVTPSAYRLLCSAPLLAATGDRSVTATRAAPAQLQGIVQAPAGDQSGVVFVGLFPAPYPQGHPVRCTVLNRPGTFTLDSVPTGRWHVLARSVMFRTDGGRRASHTPMVGGFGPITTTANHAPEPVVIRLSRENLAALRLTATSPPA